MRLKFICLNLWFGGKFFDETIQFIKEQDPDIIALQEVYDGHDSQLPPNNRTMDEFKKLLSFPYSDFQAAFQDARTPGNIDWGNAVFSKFPIKKSKVVFFDVPYGLAELPGVTDFSETPRNLEHVEIEVDGKILHVFNTQGIWGFDGNDNLRRLAMADIIVDTIGDKTPAILCGDFNVDQNTDTIRKMEKKMTNIFKGEFKSSFNLEIKKGGNFGNTFVDMIFVTPDINVLSHQMPQIQISDHLPLIAEVEI